MYFKQINLLIPQINYEPYIDKHVVSYGKNKLLSYYTLKNEAKDPIFALLPEKLRDKVDVLYCHSGSIEPNVVPHIDNGVNVSVNFYLETAGASTLFFKQKENTTATPTSNIDSTTISNTTGKVFNLNQLDFVSAFKAYPGDAYILDTSKVHAVKGLELPSIRKFICIQTGKYTFNEFVEMFND